jgi:hypothetical protein|nr:MAG TPA: hypothetical protein [Caudoviricetes sp.]
MTITEMFAICDSCVYAPCLCGNDPENCVAHVMRTSFAPYPRQSASDRVVIRAEGGELLKQAKDLFGGESHSEGGRQHDDS